MKKKNRTDLSRAQIITLCLAVQAAYLEFDREDYCDCDIKRCGGCYGCIEYERLKSAYEITMNPIYISEAAQ